MPTQSLIDEGSDPLVTDYQGSSVFSKLAKEGHIWCLNFMFNTIWYCELILVVQCRI